MNIGTLLVKKGTWIGILVALALPAHGQQRESDRLDIKKLEDKYWSAKDDDFSVVQNRAFPKEKRVFATLQGGLPINDPYSTGTLSGLSAGYHFTERWGVEFSYLKSAFSKNDAMSRFQSDHETYPNHNVLSSTQSLQINYIPLYAKMSFLDKRIIYFDMGVGLIFGQTSFKQARLLGNTTDGFRESDVTKSEMHYGLSIYQHFFLSRLIALKVDYRNIWTNEERLRYKLSNGESEANRSIGKKLINDSMLLLGLTFFF